MPPTTDEREAVDGQKKQNREQGNMRLVFVLAAADRCLGGSRRHVHISKRQLSIGQALTVAVTERDTPRRKQQQ